MRRVVNFALKIPIEIGVSRGDQDNDAAECFQLAQQFIELIALLPAYASVFPGIRSGFACEQAGITPPHELTAVAIDLRQTIEELAIGEPIGRVDLRVAAHGKQPLAGDHSFLGQ